MAECGQSRDNDSRMPDQKPTLDYGRPEKPKRKPFLESFWGMALGELFAAILTYILMPLGIIYLMVRGCWSHSR